MTVLKSVCLGGATAASAGGLASMFAAPAWLTALAQAGVVIFFMIKTVKAERAQDRSRITVLEEKREGMAAEIRELKARLDQIAPV